MKVLIIGATSFLGNALYNTYKSDSVFDVTGTRFSSKNDELVYFDILNDSVKNIVDINKNTDNTDKFAIICSALSSISIIENNRDSAFNFNVHNTKRIIDELKELDYKIIFISSNSVYSGLSDFDTENTPMNPSTLYGKTKAEVEKYINETCKDYVILRPSKIIHYMDHKKNLLTEWYETALSGGTFNCIENCSLSVIDVMDIANVLSIIIKNRITGTFNVSTGERLEREELVRRFLSITGMKAKVVVKPIEQFNFIKGYPMANSVTNDKIIKYTGYEFLSYDDILNKYKDNL